MNQTANENFISSLFSLADCTAVVTGGGSGIGRRIGLALARAGARVVLIGRRPTALQEAAAEIDDQCGDKRAAVLAADVSDLAAAPQIAAQAASFFWAPSILVNAAGINLRTSPHLAESTDGVTIDGWQQTLNTNLGAPFFLSRAMVAGMTSGGSIINIGSLQSLRAGLGDAGYGASKGGIAQLTRLLARTWGGQNIRVNAILPGYFPSDLTQMLFADPQLSAALAQNTLLGRNGELADMDGAAVFLASPASAYITGVLLPIDGGFLAK